MDMLDRAALGEWLKETVPEFGELNDVSKFSGGQSNPTYRISSSNAERVLRKKPAGELLPKAHAIEREYGLLSALHPVSFPVPRPIAFCDDPKILGTPFYIMEMVEGRTFIDGTLIGIERDDKRRCYESLIDVLADLHSIDYEKLGLEAFGRSENYLERQVDRWTKQYRLTQTDDIPDIENLIEWLPKTIPEQGSSSIIHGDFRIDNVVFGQEKAEIRAVLDWELSTIGDPIADFAYFALCCVLPRDGRAGLAGLNFSEHNIPRLSEMVARYQARRGLTDQFNLPWYFAFNLFRMVGIVQGIKHRAANGNASSEQADAAISQLKPLASLGWTQAQQANEAFERKTALLAKKATVN